MIRRTLPWVFWTHAEDQRGSSVWPQHSQHSQQTIDPQTEGQPNEGSSVAVWGSYISASWVNTPLTDAELAGIDALIYFFDNWNPNDGPDYD